MSGGLEIGLWVLLIVASMTDLFWGKIYNVVNFTFLSAGLLCHFLTGGLPAVASGGLAVGAALLFFFPLYLFGAMAAGDVKLLMAAGAWSDTEIVIRLGIYAIIIGALVGVFLLLKREGFKQSLRSIVAVLLPHRRGPGEAGEEAFLPHRMPLAPAFLCAMFAIKIAERYPWGIV